MLDFWVKKNLITGYQFRDANDKFSAGFEISFSNTHKTGNNCTDKLVTI